MSVGGVIKQIVIDELTKASTEKISKIIEAYRLQS